MEDVLKRQGPGQPDQLPCFVTGPVCVVWDSSRLVRPKKY